MSLLAECSAATHRLLLVYQETLGLDIKNGVYTSFGPAETPISFNSREDISSSIVRISVLAAADPNSVPDFTRINGSAASYNQLAALVGKARGTEIQVVEVDDAEAKKLLSTGDHWTRFWRALRYEAQSFRRAIASTLTVLVLPQVRLRTWPHRLHQGQPERDLEPWSEILEMEDYGRVGWGDQGCISGDRHPLRIKCFVCKNGLVSQSPDVLARHPTNSNVI